MNLSESFLTALDSLLANKLRSILTMLGVIIGVAAVIALLSIGNGVQESITGEINSIGTNLIIINTDFETTDGVPSLTLGDVEALADPLRVPAVSEVAAIVQGNEEVVGNGRSIDTTVAGITANYLAVYNQEEFLAGDGLTTTDLGNRTRVAVLGYEAALDLFPNEYPVGQSVKINGVSYEVIGVLAESDSNITDTDSDVYIPLTTAQVRLFTGRTRSGEKAVSSITAQARSTEENDLALEQITEVLRQEHDIAYAADDDFSLISQEALLETFNTITGTLTAFLGAIAGISLVVGGIGIMNIMLVSVTERTREIGIRKAIGALRRDILMQFLLESVVLSLIGGTLGILLGWLIALVSGNALDIDTVIDIGTVVLATGFAAGVGLVFGIYPAWRAASLRPIEALRYE